MSEGGKAAGRGLEAGDVIEAVNGQQCSTREQAVSLIQNHSSSNNKTSSSSPNILHLTVIRYVLAVATFKTWHSYALWSKRRVWGVM